MIIDDIDSPHITGGAQLLPPLLANEQSFGQLVQQAALPAVLCEQHKVLLFEGEEGVADQLPQLTVALLQGEDQLLFLCGSALFYFLEPAEVGGGVMCD